MSSAGSITLRCVPARKWDVSIDGKKVGDIAPGEEKTFQLDAEQHFVQLNGPYGLSSELVGVIVDQDRPLQLDCGIHSPLPKGITAPWVLTWLSLALSLLVTMAQSATLPFVLHWRMQIFLCLFVVFLVSLLNLIGNLRKPGALYYLKTIDSDHSARSAGPITLRFAPTASTKSHILVDGKKVGDIAVGEEKTFQLDVGRHTVLVKHYRSRSEPLDVVVNKNHPLLLVCGFPSSLPKAAKASLLLAGVSLLLSVGSSILFATLPFMHYWRIQILILQFSLLAIILISAFIFIRYTRRPGASVYLKTVDGDQPGKA